MLRAGSGAVAVAAAATVAVGGDVGRSESICELVEIDERSWVVSVSALVVVESETVENEPKLNLDLCQLKRPY